MPELAAALPAALPAIGDIGASLGEGLGGLAGGLGAAGAGLGEAGAGLAGDLAGGLAGGLSGLAGAGAAAGDLAAGGLGELAGGAGAAGALGGDLAATGGLSLAEDAALPASSALTASTDIGSSIFPGLNTAADPAAAGALPSIDSAAATSPASIGGAAPSAFSSLLSSPSSLVGLGGLGYNLYQGYQTKQALQSLADTENANAAQAKQLATTEENAAQPLLTGGANLMQYLQTGTLPQAFQSQVDQAIASAKARIIQGYATRGMSTDPTQNSGLAQDLANADQQGLTLKSNLESTLSTAGNQMVQTANQLLQSGLSATEFGAQLPLKVAELNNTLNKDMATSIAQFAAALNGGGKGYNPNSFTINLNPNSGGLQGFGQQTA